MFCPKCGTENPNANKFCRACRESLLVVAQAMKKRLPVMIVSKIDAALERLSERFRRDSILGLFFGSGMLISTVIRFNRPVFDGFDLFFSMSFSVMGILFGVWSYLAYKRSLTLGELLESGAFSSGSAARDTVRSLGIHTLDLSEAENRAKPEQELQIHFCPACGANAQEPFKHCRSCGSDLQVIRKAVKPSRWRVWLNYHLDSHIERTSDKSRIRENVRQSRWMILVWLFWILLGTKDFYKDWDPTYLLFGCVFLVIVLWDRAATRRWFAEEEKGPGSSQPVLTNDAPSLTTNELAFPSVPATLPMSIAEETTRLLEPALVQSQEEAETRKL